MQMNSIETINNVDIDCIKMNKMKTLTIYIPSYQCNMTISFFLHAIKRAKANPNASFNRTIYKWWGGTGHDIMKEFIIIIHEKISENKPGKFINVSAS
jgi:hypothetical protein